MNRQTFIGAKNRTFVDRVANQYNCLQDVNNARGRLQTQEDLENFDRELAKKVHGIADVWTPAESGANRFRAALQQAVIDAHPRPREFGGHGLMSERRSNVALQNKVLSSPRQKGTKSDSPPLGPTTAFFLARLFLGRKGYEDRMADVGEWYESESKKDPKQATILLWGEVIRAVWPKLKSIAGGLVKIKGLTWAIQQATTWLKHK